MIRILITGSRDHADWVAIESALTAAVAELRARPGRESEPVMIVHGGARGADRIAGAVARRRGWSVEVHPADWDTYRKAAGHRRNAEMVAAGADICLAFPLGRSPGTRGCVALAEKAGIPVRVFEVEVGAA